VATSPRVRFAPSPTGFLHVGGARTALFNWLYARHHGGTFVLRIEDTDRQRSTAEMTRAILDGMQWLGLSWDEGPFHQADGIERHREDALRLLAEGHAYRCFCTAERLDAEREKAAAAGTGWSYDRRCLPIDAYEARRRADTGEASTIRFRVPEGSTAWEDAVHGTTSFANADIDDFIILRSDGTPIYNMAVVSDDIAMRITHVLRGDDHLSNTPKQLLLYRALGVEPPVFAHLPMILGPDGKRLSKRHGATAIGEYHARGMLSDAMVNFLALLGWSPGTDEEVFTRDELVARFSLEGINRKSAVFDTAKLEWLNGHYLNQIPTEHLVPDVLGELQRRGQAAEVEAQGERLQKLIDLAKPRARNLDDIVRQLVPYVTDPIEYDEDAVAKYWKDAPETAQRLTRLRTGYAALGSWDEASLEAELRAVADELGVGAGKLIHPVRVALTGFAVSPGIFEVLALMGRERTLSRLARAAERLGAARDGEAGGGKSP
jgi:glutamyl-tRNA synthetase